MAAKYLFQFFDDIFTAQLMPDKLSPATLNADQAEKLGFLIAGARISAFEQIKEQVFGIYQKQEAIQFYLLNDIALQHLVAQTGRLKDLEDYHNEHVQTVLETYLNALCSIAEYLKQSLRHLLPEDLTQESKVYHPKVIANLSVDQLSLIARGAKDANVIIGSLNHFFKDIAAKVSTKRTADISASNMQKKSYAAERFDKEAAITALQKIINAIEGY